MSDTISGLQAAVLSDSIETVMSPEPNTSQAIPPIRPAPLTLAELAKFAVAAIIIVAAVVFGTSKLTYNWQWYRVPRYLFREVDGRIHPGILFEGLAVTLQISGISLVLAAVFGMVTALFRLSRSFTANLIARVYLESIRNTPLLIQLFFIYFIISPILNIPPFFSAVLALSLFEGAYASEIIRGGIVSIPRGQWESAYSLGLSSYRTYRSIILPQVFRQILPPITGQAISLVKDSALVSTIAIYDLTMQGAATVSETFLTFEIWFTVAAIYLIINGTLSLLVHTLEKRLRRSP